MTPLERVNLIRKQTETFARKGMLKHQLLNHFEEIRNDTLEEAAKIADEYTGEKIHWHELALAIRNRIRELKSK